ncbi:MAG TPA: aminoglycoside adenylyltransferase domain-containing protein [Candidatus Sulfotelmatobacter sp.]|nr:aminoglycoside adenylyltransferase domain-containing protein [Candidatus Sulfotelmatobacter sp.]
MKDSTPYPAINTVLCDWVEGVKSLLGEKVVGLYLSGSLAYGDFVLERSDIDLQAVVRNPLTQDELRLIEQLHRQIEGRCPEWANRIECSYVPLELMRELTPPATPRPWWGFGTFYAEAPAGNEWIINHYLLSRHGIALWGPDFNELIPPIDIDCVRRASARDLFQEWVPKIDDSKWLSSSHYQSYLVLNLCRILHTVIGGQPVSKKVAGEWAKSVYPQWKSLIEEAERWTYGDKMTRQADAVSFLRFAVERVNETELCPAA